MVFYAQQPGRQPRTEAVDPVVPVMGCQLIQQHPQALFAQIFLIEQAVTDRDFAGVLHIGPRIRQRVVNDPIIHPGKHRKRLCEILPHVLIGGVLQPAVELQRRQHGVVILTIIVIPENAAVLQIEADGFVLS